jgi:hypothetical protein
MIALSVLVVVAVVSIAAPAAVAVDPCLERDPPPWCKEPTCNSEDPLQC